MKIFKKNSILKISLICFFIAGASGAEPKVELFGESQDFNVKFFSIDSDSNKSINFKGGVGFFATPNFEPVISLYVVRSTNYKESDNEINSTYLSVSPGLAFNFSEDTGNSFVFYLGPGLSYNYYVNTYNHDNKSAQFKWISTQFYIETFVGKRFKLTESVSWYPKIGYWKCFANDKSKSSSQFSIVPVSLSILF